MAGEFDEIVDGAELGDAVAARRGAVVAAIVEHADDAHVGIALRGKRGDQRLAVVVGADDDGAAVEAALPRPAPHQEEQGAAKCDQRDQPDHVEAAEPDAGELVAGFGEERHADGEQKYHGPRRGEPHVLFFMAAKRLDLIDVGRLERQHGKQRDAGNGADIVPGKTVERHDVPEVQTTKPTTATSATSIRRTDAGEHDRRIGGFERLRGDLQRGGRQRVGAGALRSRRAASAVTADDSAAAVSKIVLGSGAGHG